MWVTGIYTFCDHYEGHSTYYRLSPEQCAKSIVYFRPWLSKFDETVDVRLITDDPKMEECAMVLQDKSVYLGHKVCENCWNLHRKYEPFFDGSFSSTDNIIDL